MSTSATTEIVYEESDLKGQKSSLVVLVARQSDKWPGPDVYSACTTTIKRLRAVLLDPRYGFTKPGPTASSENDLVSSALSPLPTEKDDTPEPEERNKDPEIADPQPYPSRWMKLFIEDTRRKSTAKISQELCLVVVDTEDCAPGEWRAEIRDLLVELQESNSAITGSVRLSFQDPEQPEYWMPFVKVTDDALLEEAETFLEVILILSTNHLKILVEHAEDTYFHAPPQHLPVPGSSIAPLRDTFDVNDPEAKPLEHARSRAANRPRGSQTDSDADAEWLTEQLKNTLGYEDFKNNQRKVQSNPGVATSWNFIANFSAAYFKQVSHVQVKISVLFYLKVLMNVQGRKRIQKKSIGKALGLGSTALAEAENAARILKSYGEDGSNPAQTVIDRFAMIEETPGGARCLYPFLVNSIPGALLSCIANTVTYRRGTQMKVRDSLIPHAAAVPPLIRKDPQGCHRHRPRSRLNPSVHRVSSKGRSPAAGVADHSAGGASMDAHNCGGVARGESGVMHVERGSREEAARSHKRVCLRRHASAEASAGQPAILWPTHRSAAMQSSSRTEPSSTLRGVMKRAPLVRRHLRTRKQGCSGAVDEALSRAERSMRQA
ncbi:hypothetical protein DFH09DRAFT_1084139 [Mycena vulgaris]|nr:hypothetical protein DFH09DRAFT_1084139 [Mycena vulgaris]